MTHEDEDTHDTTAGTARQATRGPLDRLRGTLVPGVVRQSLLAKILLGLVLVMVLSGVAAGYFYLGISDDLDEEVDREVEATAGLHEDVYSDWFAGLQVEVGTVAEKQALQTDNERQISTALLLELSDSISEYHYVSTETGEILISTSASAEGETLFDRGFDTERLERQQFTSPGRYTTTAGRDVIAIGQKILAKDAALVAEIDISRTAPTLEQPIAGANTSVLTRSGAPLVGGSPTGEMPTDLANGTQVDETGDEIVAYRAVGSTEDLVVATQTPKDAAFALSDTVLRSFVLTIALTFVILLGVTVVGGRSITRDLNALVDQAVAMGDGDLDVDLATGRDDEIGTLYAEFDAMRGQLKDRIDEASEALDRAQAAQADAESAREDAESAREQAERMNDHLEEKAAEYNEVMRACAEGDFTRRMDTDSESEAMAQIAREFNGMIAEIERTIGEVTAFATEVAAASATVTEEAAEIEDGSVAVSDRTQEIASGANDQRRNLGEIAGEMSSLSASIEEAASSSSQVAETSRRTVERGTEGQEAAEAAIQEINRIESQTDRTVEQITTLEERMAEIGEVVEVITDIADQTNMLALNANIEAARAGDGSSGFAVVADEIKQLAEETREATAEIDDIITETQRHTETTVAEIEETSEAVARGVETVEEALAALEEIVEQVEDTNRGVQDISQATEDQAESTQRVVSQVETVEGISDEVADQTDDVAAVAQQQTAVVTRIVDSTDSLQERADALVDTLERFEVDDSATTRTGAATDSRDLAADGDPTRESEWFDAGSDDPTSSEPGDSEGT
jgi:methyl-accepting chemotaxis protein